MLLIAASILESSSVRLVRTAAATVLALGMDDIGWSSLPSSVARFARTADAIVAAETFSFHILSAIAWRTAFPSPSVMIAASISAGV